MAAAVIGAGGRGALPVRDHDVETARSWIELHKGWGELHRGELLEPDSITWMSIWNQGGKRLYWELSRISPSGVTGVTGVTGPG